jgi:hypothetical protein
MGCVDLNVHYGWLRTMARLLYEKYYSQYREMQKSHFHKHHDYVSEISLFENATAVMRLFCLLAVSGQSKLHIN